MLFRSDMGFSQKQSVAITYMITAILGLAAVVLTTSGEFKAMFLIGSVFIVGAIGMRLIFADHPNEKQEPEQLPPEQVEPTASQTEFSEKEDDTHEET